MKPRLVPHVCFALAVTMAMVAAGAALAQTPPQRNSPLGGLGNNKEPIKIDADRLDIFDKEQRATFTGNVIAVQGDTTMRCSLLNVYYEQSAMGGAQQQPSAPPGTDNSNVRRLDCKGPVTVVSKEQTATGDEAVFDRGDNKVVLTGRVTLSQGPNVQQCHRIVYNLDTSIANCESRPGGRVQGVFVPGSNTPAQARPGAAPRR
ncbi:LptA/OstA family protein [Chelatococcus sp. GCM10030263]|uniref:LptA/OstA family protein n=1 Tax=Chelatococcus sp. GCM10030263 TaxID=3273387 RepID=UPI00360C3D60